ncbi:MAG TPA: cytochrome ubiquinol oxidase subunit I [Phycicoccus sp.]|jgi:cytochrome d ubiquinol oxidase subunit I|nr:cytochrome ubiquinol oxidase subunit I [Phycicoccus sp.]
MDATSLARWQFAITTVYHFLFVPITIGMSFIVAFFNLMWVRTHKPEWLRLTKFFGKLFLINFALGLVTGIVQEFQFGMNWSDYSRFVGDIFGAPLAFEALLAFFMESTFLGVWIFGWGRLPEKIHMACMWLVHIGTVLSAYFILAANSFMQNPVGFKFNPDTGRAEMADFIAVLFNKVQLVTFPHVITASYMTGGAVVMGVALWLAMKHRNSQDASMYRKATRIGAWVSLVASLLVIVTGDIQGKIMTEVQPMKMAAAEAIYETQSNAPFSVLSIGSLDGSQATRIIEVPGLLSFLATGDFNGKVVGINEARAMEKELAAKVTAQYGPEVGKLAQDGTYTPMIPVTYWTFRLMMGLGFISTFLSIMVLWGTRKGAIPQGWFWKQAAIWNPLLPVLAISFGWIFTEIGRQPWIVYGLMTTATGVSPSVSAGEVLFSMIVYTLLYAGLAVIEVKLFLTYVKRGAEPFEDPGDHADVDEDAPLQFAY